LEKIKDFKSGFVLIYAGNKIKLARLRGLAPACFLPDEGQMVNIEFIPDLDEQSNSVWGEGPAIIAQSKIMMKISSDKAFDFLRSQIVVERIQEKFPEIKGFVPIEDGIILISQHLTRSQRIHISGNLMGVYTRENIYFCAGNKVSDDILSIQKALLKKSLPLDWELIQSDNWKWSNRYQV